MTTDNERITVYVPPGYKDKLKEYAESEDRSVSFVSSKVLEDYVDELIKLGRITPFINE